MFQRFTKEAPAVVVGAHEVGRDTGSRSIDTRHLLVVLVEDPGAPVDRALRMPGPTSRRSPRRFGLTSGAAVSMAMHWRA